MKYDLGKMIAEGKGVPTYFKSLEDSTNLNADVEKDLQTLFEQLREGNYLDYQAYHLLSEILTEAPTALYKFDAELDIVVSDVVLTTLDFSPNGKIVGVAMWDAKEGFNIL